MEAMLRQPVITCSRALRRQVCKQVKYLIVVMAAFAAPAAALATAQSDHWMARCGHSSAAEEWVLEGSRRRLERLSAPVKAASVSAGQRAR